MVDLSLVEFKANLREFAGNTDDLIKEVIGKITPEYQMVFVFRYAYIDRNNIDKGIQYYNNLIEQIARLSEYNFTTDDLDMYKEYIALLFNIENIDYDIEKSAEMLNKTFTSIPARYVQYMTRYNILLWYSSKIYMDGSYLPKLRELLKICNETKDEYDELTSAIDSQVIDF